MNLLESAGFSRSNPYYVVQQGKIASLTLMKDSERLDLLKEIGGTRVYEERRRESLKIMQETGNKKKQIIQVVQYLDERLRELDEEKEELKKYQQLDKQRRSLEYTIYDKELHDSRQRFGEAEEARNKISEKLAKLNNDEQDAGEKAKDLDKDLKDLTKSSQVLNKEKSVVEKRRTEAMKKHAKVELDFKDLEEQISGNIRAKEEASKELEVLKKKIQESRDELETIRALYNDQIIREEEITKGIMDREKKLSILYQKQGRATQFSSKAARDKWLQKELDDLQRVLSTNLEQEKKLEDEIQELKHGLQKQDSYVEEREIELQELNPESDLSAELDKLKVEVTKAEKSLDHATPGDIRRGLQSVRRLCRDHNIHGVLGPIIELLNCDEKFFTAVEVTAGNSLFHVVVETDEISTRIIRYLNSEKGGRVTFIPLNRVTAPNITYPNNSDTVPLLKKLTFSPSQAKAAFKQVFGRTVICRDLDVATKVARTDGLDCITLEGDQVNKKGGMTGGFYDYRRSKLKFMDIIRQNTKAIRTKEEKLEKIRAELEDILISQCSIDQEITKLVAKQQKDDAQQAHDKSELEQLKQDITNALKQNASIVKALEKKDKLLANARIQIEQLRAGMAIKRAEMGTDLIDHLTPEERDLLSRFNPEITELKEKLIAYKAERIETETRKGELETNQSANLVRRQQELEAVILSVDADVLPGEADLKKQELMEAKASVDDATQQLKSEKLALQDKCQHALKDEEKELERLLSKKNVYLAKQEDCMKKIRDLGSLPSDAFETYKRKSTKELHKMLHKCNEQLQQFSHVNKKALDQYVNFTEQREELQNRQAELDAGDEKIMELISVLDQRKDESIERTFKGVARHFRDAFSELVPGGRGFLDGDHGDADIDDDGPRETDPEGRVEKYIGVKVKVSFTGQGETQSMKQLSGGQKTVVALTLIFAIQRCDPAPFYLFDEIDAALDPQYRTAVGNMIRRLADMANTQFITTTFRPELVRVADKIYGVTHKNRVSCVNVISKEQALDFIEHDQSGEIEYQGSVSKTRQCGGSVVARPCIGNGLSQVARWFVGTMTWQVLRAQGGGAVGHGAARELGSS
ncbi:hypothetical protein Sjap_019146 [Stephania japonica]|uniref:SMC hinge domain-containing protein n=1 Tax=Stephania japonica TaxID=461633 RepID=A0AAP0HXW9_9MAGN